MAAIGRKLKTFSTNSNNVDFFVNYSGWRPPGWLAPSNGPFASLEAYGPRAANGPLSGANHPGQAPTTIIPSKSTLLLY